MRKNAGNGRITRTRGKKSDLTKLKEAVWKECRRLVIGKYGNTCYTCGKSGLSGSNLQVGHFITSSTCSTELRYDLDNLRPQDFHCNINLSGNWTAFYKNLCAEIGEDAVKELIARNERTKGGKYGSFWLQERLRQLQELSVDNRQSRER